MSKLLLRAARRIKTGREFMDSKWQNCEAETIAIQTIHACAENFKEHGEAISWQGKGTLRGRAACGTDNAHGLSLLINDGMLVSEKFTGTLKPDEPDDIAMKSGKYLVLRCSEKLLRYFIEHTNR